MGRGNSGPQLTDFSPPTARRCSQLPRMSEMFPQPLIRPARTVDSQAIATLMREGVSEQVRQVTIMGSPHLAQFIADELAMEGSEDYVVGVMQERVVGMCSWKHNDEVLHLNHIYLAQEIQGRGLGSALMLDGLRRIRRSMEDRLNVDVFFDNPRAQAWYRLLTMRPVKHVRWIRLPLPIVESADWSCCSISGLAEASVKHSRYGFSQFVLSTNTATYQVGRLGSHDFRVGTVSILRDRAALQGLAHLDAKRQLLCVASEEDWTGLSFGPGICVAESERLVSSSVTVMEHLESALSRRGSHQAIPVRL